MATEHEPAPDIDLDRTDKLPILEGVTVEEDVADDAVRLDHAETDVAITPFSAQPPAEGARTAVDLPSLAQSVRSVEERIARHTTDYDALNRLYEKARDAQRAAGTRADSLAAELSSAHTALAVEQHRTRELERSLSGSAAAADAARSRSEESLREAERAQGEARTLREGLAARDMTIVQSLHSLGERDAQLFALQREHAQIVPVLEARSRASAQLETDLKAARDNVETLSAELSRRQEALSSLEQQLVRAQSELGTERRDLQVARAEQAAYLELLRSRDWRREFQHNLLREATDERDARHAGESTLRTELEQLRADCEQLREVVAASTVKLASYETAIAKLQAAGGAQSAELAQKSQDLEDLGRERAELQRRLDTLADEAQRSREASEDAGARLAATSAQIEQLRAAASTHDEELTVLMAHLNEARRPMQSVQADIKRLNDELAAKSHIIEQLTEQNRAVRATLERTRGALEERELLIRRLERSANNSANVLGRLQTSIERLGTSPPPPLAGEFLAELIKLEGDTRTAYALGRRTRVGRAPGCELQIDSQSVSRHHALLLKGMREIIVEDLNSTNGVLVNGRKVTRQVLSDGDLLTIGETQFQCRLKPHLRGAEIPSPAADGEAGVAGEASPPSLPPSTP